MEQELRDSNDAEPPGRLRVGITYNVKKDKSSDAEAEFDDMDTILAIKGALEEREGISVSLYEARADLSQRLLGDRPDLVFNIAEGSRGRGREAQVPAILSFLGIPYTGSDETSLCLAMDKALTKQIVSSQGIRTPISWMLRAGTEGAELPHQDLPYPLIVKPNSEGSSKGISALSVVRDDAALRRVVKEKIALYGVDMLLEEYIPGREFTVGILGNGEEEKVFPPMEIVFLDQEKTLYSYEVKRNFKHYVRYECPPKISDALKQEMEGWAKKVYHALGCQDVSRVDFRLSPEGKIYFIEINPLPGLAPGYSDLVILSGLCGMEYPNLVQGILDSALKRYGLL